MLRALFNSDAFKNARFAKVKSPAEMVAGTLRITEEFARPKPGLYPIAHEIRYMGQDLLNPPTVEGWHTGTEWIDSGTLVERLNFAAGEVGKVESPGIRAIVRRLAGQGSTLTPKRLLEGCLEMLGCYELSADTYGLILEEAQKSGDASTSAPDFPERVGQMLQFIVSTQEYQFA
jgi:hypothetical protein